MAYFDYAATNTYISEKVLKTICHMLCHENANPSSQYYPGYMAKEVVANARREIAKHFQCQPEEIIFTSGGSEADNMAIKGVVFASSAKKKHIITTNIEHKAVLETCKFLELQGLAEVTYLNVDKLGYVSPDQLAEAINENTILVSIMMQNNETGVRQDIKSLAEVARKRNVLFHTDAVQAAGKTKINLEEIGVDLMSVSGHKFGAPKGVGFLYVRKGTPVEPLIHGGGQEFGMRAGTENVAYIAALEAAVSRIRYEDAEVVSEIISKFSLRLMSEFGDNVFFANTNYGSGILSFALRGVDALELQSYLDDNQIFVSVGSACSSGEKKPSHVLEALGKSKDIINNFIRVSVSADTTKWEIDDLIDHLKFYYSLKNENGGNEV